MTPSRSADDRSCAALAKINLALHVGKVQRDGYHPVDTLCVFAPAGDVLTIEGPSDDFSLSVHGPDAAGLSGGDNLVLRAARAFAEAVPGCPRVSFRLDKRVPAASGIGGGTSNGAAALVLLNRAMGAPLAPHRLVSLSQVLGADGPVCTAPLVMAGSSFCARGIGEDVVRGPTLPPLFLCLANPRAAVPTGPVFRAFDRAPVPAPFDLPPLNMPATPTAVVSWFHSVRNDLAPAAIALLPRIAKLADAMDAAPGCLAARMSGSGATVFGLFADRVSAARAATAFRGQGGWAVSAPVHGTGAG